MIENRQQAPQRDTRRLEQVLDAAALAGLGIFLALTVAGVFTWADTGWNIGLFQGWLLRHLLH